MNLSPAIFLSLLVSLTSSQRFNEIVEIIRSLDFYCRLLSAQVAKLKRCRDMYDLFQKAWACLVYSHPGLWFESSLQYLRSSLNQIVPLK